MNSESVIEFLGCVPLLQRLPGSSLHKIAQFVITKHYDRGDYVVREGEPGDGIYFIWEGQAVVSVGILRSSQAQVRAPLELVRLYLPTVSGSVLSEGDQPEFNLTRYDYFGHGTAVSAQNADVIALSKLTCLVLPHAYSELLHPSSIWNADETLGTCSLVEKILHLDPLDVNIFRGITLPDAPRFGKVFGGQFMGQALAAASKTVDCLKVVHSLHAYFLLIGDLDLPIIYQVHRVRDGKSFATRRVDAIQKGNVVFTMNASFQKGGGDFSHQEAKMPSVPDPEALLNLEELRERRLTDPCLPRSYRIKVASTNFVPWPIEMRFCEPTNNTMQNKAPPRLRYWFRAKGKLSDDPALHRCVVAFASDLVFLTISMNPHRRVGQKTSDISLDHSMWFHRPVKADDWLLFVIQSPSAESGRGFVSGQMFNRKGELVVSLTQEGLLRKIRPPASNL